MSDSIRGVTMIKPRELYTHLEDMIDWYNDLANHWYPKNQERSVLFESNVAKRTAIEDLLTDLKAKYGEDNE